MTPSLARLRIAFIHATLLAVLTGLLVAPVPTRAATPLPACRYTDITTRFTAYSDWQRTLLDPIYRVSSGYAPATQATSTAGIGGGGTLRDFTNTGLRALKSAANRAGVPLYVKSAYRSYATQKAVFDSWVRRVGYQEALRSSARPGHSEHQMGTTVDFTHAAGVEPWNYADWATTRTGAWLKANAWRYGWLMSYPKGKESVTCYKYEPWHYRYVGLKRATQVRDSGLTLREFLWYRGGNG